MPIYDFRYQKCDRVSEIFVHSSNQAVNCPHCGGNSMERLMSSAFIIKTNEVSPGTTCCGSNEQCEKPPAPQGMNADRNKE